jgi:hypothetical protein
MVDVTHKKCLHEGCTKLPIYNEEGQKKGLYCFEHKKEGMVDVVNKKCLHEGCTKQPKYNEEGQKTGLYCSTHKKEGMVDVVNKTCKSDWCSTYVQEKYDGYCLFCYMHLFPDKPVSRNYKTKERSVVNHVKISFPDVDWIADKIVHGGCSKRRPDLILDLGYLVLIIEIDENQHIDYDSSCETKRIMELSQDVGHRSTVFIRFNPDDYKICDKRITSCWTNDAKGICRVKKSKEKEWNERLKALSDRISYWTNPENKTEKTIEIEKLFYD